MRTYLTVAVLGLCVTACASTPAAIQYYRMSTESSEQGIVVESNAPVVVLEAVELPSFLTQPGLVLQSGVNQISVSKTHLWAERLDKALPRLLVTKLRQRSDRFAFYDGGSDWTADPDYRLRVRIDNFQPTTAGEIVASGTFQVMDVKPGDSPVLHDFSYSQDLRADGYAAAVAQMDALLGQIADQILVALIAGD